MAAEVGGLGFSVASVVEDVLLQQQGTHLRDVDSFESRKAEEAAARRFEAAGWLRKMVGVVAARDLPAEPSEEEFRHGLRSGIILCNVLNKVQPGAVPKVVEGPYDSTVIPEGAALSAFQYFENVRNFLVAVQEMGVPTFEASDLEQGGKTSRIVNCIVALKSFADWKQSGGNGIWKFGGNLKPTTSSKPFIRKNSEPFMSSLSRNTSVNEKSLGAIAPGMDSNKMTGSLAVLVRTMLLDKKPEEVPAFVESVLSKVAEEFENRICNQYDLRSCPNDLSSKTQLKSTSNDKKIDEKNIRLLRKDKSFTTGKTSNEESKALMLKQRTIFDERQRDIEDLKAAICTTKAGMQYMQRKFHEEFSNLAVHVRSLAHAASGYHRVLEENRKLYNQVQDLKGSIRVYCRVRPFLHGQSTLTSTVENIEEGIITISTPSKYGKGQRSFNFNKVFGPSATQAEVFSDTQPLIRSVLDGYNVCIFAYGQTGSGKTYTMTGPKQLTEQSQGVNYRALSDLFYLAEQRKDSFRYDVAVQMIEIYNEQVRDLLVSDGTNKRLEIRNSSQTGLSVPDASLVPVTSTSDVLGLMNLGQRNRAVGATALNDRSSRSHSCLTVHVQGRDLTSGTILRGCMHLVDLAGSERVDKSEATGDRLKEAQHINKSLSALGDVISSLAQKNPHVPYRNSKLTQLLQDSLGGQAKTLMFVHISPEPNALGETISTLKFAERVATVELGAAKVNKDSSDVKELKEQIASLKAALARKEEEPPLVQPSKSSEQRRRKASEFHYFNANQLPLDVMNGSCRQPMGDVGNIEVFPDSATKQKKQCFDLDELLGNSPLWPPVPSQTYGEDEKETGSGEWEDKVMVNKQDEISLGCWDAQNGNPTNVFSQSYLKDYSQNFPVQTYNVFTGGNGFSNTASNDVDDLDAATSDSSEPELLWQFSQTKLDGIASGAGAGAGVRASKHAGSKLGKSSDMRNMHLIQGPSPSRKPANGSGLPMHQAGRQQSGADGKRRPNNSRK